MEPLSRKAVDSIYSVLIQNQKTMEQFHQFHPLFLEQLNAGSIGLCRWMESGTSVETALPELYDMVNDKDKWRAIIVRLEDEKDMAGFPVSKVNPFDFDPDFTADESLAEQIPLVRLTRMLGGVPAPEITFREETISEEGKSDRVVYVPVEDDEANERYEALCRRYHFDGVRPTEILMISVRKELVRTKEDIRNAWLDEQGDLSSFFWKRNGYPSMCRFLVYELADKGPYRYRADMFRFWTTVLLLATNEIDASTLQAYRLYRTGVEISGPALKRCFQTASSRTVSARKYIEREIETQRLEKQRDIENTQAPDYRLSVSVALQTPATSEAEVSEDIYGSVSDGASKEIGAWNMQDSRARYVIRQIIKSVERSLDEAAMGMHGKCGYPPESVKELNRYQVEDMEESLERQRFSILNKREALPIGETACARELDAADRAVRKELLRRFTGSPLGIGYAIFAALVLLCCVPGFLLGYVYAPDSLGGVAGAAAGLLIFGAIGALIGALIQRAQIRRLLKQYNIVLDRRVAEMADSALVYSDYLSTIASHIHGRSYMNTLLNRALGQEEVTMDERYHLRELQRFQHRLKTWGKALHISVDYSVGLEREVTVDTRSSAVSNPLYALETGNDREVPVNRSGITVQSPVGFVTKLVIQQEELYDDRRPRQ